VSQQPGLLVHLTSHPQDTVPLQDTQHVAVGNATAGEARRDRKPTDPPNNMAVIAPRTYAFVILPNFTGSILLYSNYP